MVPQIKVTTKNTIMFGFEKMILTPFIVLLFGIPMSSSMKHMATIAHTTRTSQTMKGAT